MDDFGGKDNNYGLKLLVGTIIGLIVILFLVPLGANMIATEEVSSAANDAFNSLDNSYGKPSLSIPIGTVNLDNLKDIPVINNTTNINATTKVQNNNITIANNTDNQNNTNKPSEENNTPANVTPDKQEADLSNMKILSGSITTGSSLESKSVCKVYVGKEYSGQNIQISTLYSRDGSDLNAGRLVAKTVDSSGYITLRAADSYDLYPSHCLISIYDTNGKELDYLNVDLAPESGTQSF